MEYFLPLLSFMTIYVTHGWIAVYFLATGLLVASIYTRIEVLDIQRGLARCTYRAREAQQMHQ